MGRAAFGLKFWSWCWVICVRDLLWNMNLVANWAYYVHIKLHFIRQRIYSVSIRKFKLLILFREITPIYWERYKCTCILQSAVVPLCCIWLYIGIIIAGLQMVIKGDRYVVLLCISFTFCCIEETQHAGMILVSTRIYTLAVKESKVVTFLAARNTGGLEV